MSALLLQLCYTIIIIHLINSACEMQLHILINKIYHYIPVNQNMKVSFCLNELTFCNMEMAAYLRGWAEK